MGWNKGLTVVWLLLSVAITLVLTGVLWFVFHVPVLVGFLFLPFLWGSLQWIGGRRGHAGDGPDSPRAPAGPERDARGVCPVCGWRARESGERHCARDGSLLE